jgi:hypothetical protein
MILLDTNILGRITDSADPRCATSRRSIHSLRVSGEQLAIVPQNLYELPRSRALPGNALPQRLCLTL